MDKDSIHPTTRSRQPPLPLDPQFRGGPVPMQRYATPDEIAPIALLLASDAGSFITGSVFVVDGGYTLW
jgi:NAD(P)-dependent dehydrogenase (short-subunit alcohol dehydrogenase family)